MLKMVNLWLVHLKVRCKKSIKCFNECVNLLFKLLLV